MWCGLLLVVFITPGTQAFHPAPIRWGGRLGKKLFLASTVPLDRIATPQQLTLKEPFGRIFHNKIPYFTANHDNTISCDDKVMRWCLEASGTEPGHVVGVSHCAGKPTQKWRWLPQGPIQLEGTNQCIHVHDNDGLTGARVELSECASESTDAWMFEYSTPVPARSSLKSLASSIVSMGVVVMAAALGLGAWLSRRQQESRMVIASKRSVPLSIEKGGVCLSEAMAVRLGDVPLVAANDACRDTHARCCPRRFDTSEITMVTPSDKDQQSNDSSEATPTETSAPKKIRTQRILSGVQPTGTIHLGNYLGAVRQWVDMQNKVETDNETGLEIPKVNFFCVVDLHAITMPHDPAELRESTLKTAALYLASGIDPSKSKVFVQSHVPAHSELTWLLNCATPMGWLERMIQFKEKARKQGESVGVGLFTYPILMAADILLYSADRVPVGEDQRQHLELARDIATRFNGLYCKGKPYKKRCKAAGVPSRPVFLEPQAYIVKEGARVMSLQDGTSKMSKSDENDASRINVLDSPDVIRNKIKRCKTDSEKGIEWDNPDRPEATNLLNIYSAVQPERTRDDIVNEVKDLTWGEFKPLLADAVVAHLEPIQKRYAEIRSDEMYLNNVLKDGADAANEVASRTLQAARIAMGFFAP